MYRGLLSSEGPRPEKLALQRLSSAGEPLTPDVNEWAQRALGLAVHRQYGQTELGMAIGFPHHPALDIGVRPSAMDVALPGWDVTVLRDNDDELAGPGEVGRLAVVVAGSPFMTFTGYAVGRADTGRFVKRERLLPHRGCRKYRHRWHHPVLGARRRRHHHGRLPDWSVRHRDDPAAAQFDGRLRGYRNP